MSQIDRAGSARVERSPGGFEAICLVEERLVKGFGKFQSIILGNLAAVRHHLGNASLSDETIRERQTVHRHHGYRLARLASVENHEADVRFLQGTNKTD